MSRVEQSAFQKLYERPPSFTDLLPWTAYLSESQSFVLDDGVSLGAVLELFPVGTEAATEAFLVDVRESIQVALVDALPEDLAHPWVLQLYLQDDSDLSSYKRGISEYGDDEAKNSSYFSFFKSLYESHIDRVSQVGGLFVDEQVTGSEWRGKVRRIRATLYQRVDGRKVDPKYDSEQHLSDVLSRFQLALEVAGVASKRLGLSEFRSWMHPWFNPKSSLLTEPSTESDREDGQDSKDLPVLYDVGQDLLCSQPASEVDSGTWWFDDLPHEVVSIQGIRRVPSIGHLTAERTQGERTTTLFDSIPEGTVMVMTLVVKPMSENADRVAKIKKSAVGDTAEAELAREHVSVVEREIAKGNKLFSTGIAFYIRGNNRQDIKERRNQLCTLLLANGMQPIASEADLLKLDSYIRNLPMAYDPGLDNLRRRSKLMFARDVASLLPVYGRSRGKGHPGLVFFNRGAEPLSFDPLNPNDRKKNAHLLVVGPSGAGKSAMLVYLLQQIVARHRPRLFIIEAGGSFELLGEHFKAYGLSVNQITLKPDTNVSLPPFLHAMDLVDEDQSRPDDRDRLGEMEIIARVMITGGDSKESESLSRADRLLVRTAILDGAKLAKQSKSECVLTETIVEAMRNIGLDKNQPEKRRLRALEMADSMALFCSGVAGRIFNRPGTDLADADVTIFEIGLFARDGYEDQLTVAYLALMSHINDLVERYQQHSRQTLVVTDEGHVILAHPLLASYVVKITKMWRKFGAWFWIATQNLADFPDQSKRMLSMIEWWLCLTMPKDEVEQLARFRNLTESHRNLLLSAKKEPGKFVEGVVLSDEIETLFRNVPPSLSLALAMSEKHEKAERRTIMERENCTEYEAACKVAELIVSSKTKPQ